MFHRDTGGISNSAVKRVGFANDDHIPFEEGYALSSGLEHQGAGVQVFIPPDPIGWSISHVVAPHLHGLVGSDICSTVAGSQPLGMNHNRSRNKSAKQSQQQPLVTHM